ncbi:adenylate cyclase associated N terminal-domain-containing protein [Fimicolochytrium jonesii]|uniref:adenylate cyclase associated N terminal-domain-containing protein n=1 Tax=Fimicolochytrium jonesii TaxID=1396493 RepID=UPI0022FE1CF0|nr:adenylate cyclase associated N terminal-domain-containing protein [Fimicolochytrium jonesii]KAI8818196.1 adenylate cyclase associated N terminal-domain-containing protein [Fimicolochytrium jonesii]
MSTEVTLASLIKRLETATQRLEEVAARPPKAHPTTSSSTDSSSGAPAGGSHAAITAFDDLVSGPFAAYLTASNALGDLVQQQAGHVKEALAAQRALIQVAVLSKKPDLPTLQDLLKPTQGAIMKITELREKNRASQQYNHLSTVSEGIPALGWVVVEPTPGPFVGEMKESSQFWGNRVIKEFKDKDKNQADWASTFVNFLAELQAYVKKHHTTGLAWNPRGGDAKSANGSAAPAAPAAAPSAGGPPPPPPAPAVGIEPTSSSKSPAPDASALFSALNKDGLTSGLRKVDKSEMTHKNPELRAGSVVKAPTPAAGSAPKASAAAPKAPPKTSLEGSKWVVENHNNNNDIVIEQTELRHVVYIYNCQNSTIHIKGKINAVTLDNCKKTGLVLDSAVSTVDIVNSKSVQVQVTGTVPTVAIDKTDGLQLYLSAECADSVEILTGKSGEVNVCVQQTSGEHKGEFSELPVSEQFKTVVREGKLNTTCVEHKG